MTSDGRTDNANSPADKVIVSLGNDFRIGLNDVSNIAILSESFINPNFLLNDRTSYFTCNEFVTSYLFIFSYGYITELPTPFSMTNPPLAP